MSTKQTRLFVWTSRALKQYGHGRIVVAATSLDEARRIALGDLDSAPPGYGYKTMLDLRTKGDSDDQEDYARIQKDFESDIAGAPTVVEPGRALFLWGGE